MPGPTRASPSPSVRTSSHTARAAAVISAFSVETRTAVTQGQSPDAQLGSGLAHPLPCWTTGHSNYDLLGRCPRSPRTRWTLMSTVIMSPALPCPTGQFDHIAPWPLIGLHIRGRSLEVPEHDCLWMQPGPCAGPGARLHHIRGPPLGSEPTASGCIRGHAQDRAARWYACTTQPIRHHDTWPASRL